MGRFFRNAIRQGNDMGHLIELRDRTAPNPYRRLREPVNFTLDKGEHLAVIGPNGAGKSIFIDMLSGSADIRQIKFRDAFSLTGSLSIISRDGIRRMRIPHPPSGKCSTGHAAASREGMRDRRT